MGTAGSFDIATLTDLLVLDMIYHNYYDMSPAGHTYNKVGDDLWCHDPKGLIRDYYVNKLGIEINESKTKSSTPENRLGEFVSRNINFGIDVSRISVNICRAFEKNPLDLTQLSQHLLERGVDIILPIDKLFSGKKIKDDLVRTFYVQSKILRNFSAYRGTSENILKSLKYHFHDYILSDPLLSSLTGNEESVRNGFLVYAISNLIHRIKEKADTTLGVTSLEYECGIDLIKKNLKEQSFKYDGSLEPLNVRTSKFILAKTHNVIKEIGRVNQPPASPFAEPKGGIPMVTVTKASDPAPSTLDISDLVDIVDHLSSIDEGMTFKDLGIISEVLPYRPKTTLLFNFVKSLRVREYHDVLPGLHHGDEDGVTIYSTLSLKHYGSNLFGTSEIVDIIENNATIPFTKDP